MPQKLTLSAARRVALAAQGLSGGRPSQPGRRQAARVLGTLAQVQLDSIQVLTRAHRMPLFSRLGPHDPGLLGSFAEGRRRRLFEYWGHAACLIDVDLQPALRFRMAAARDEAWDSMVRVQRDHRGLVADALAVVVERGASTAREVMAELEDSSPEHHRWGWNWSLTKSALEWLFWSGALTSAGRTAQFERRYDLPERVLPARVLATATPSIEQAHRQLVGRAARALGVATRQCLRDYFRTARAATDRAIDGLVETGELLPVVVPGWSRQAFLWHRARIPASVDAACLVSPFDSLIFERRRTAGLFGMDYRIEIYLPQEKRRHGYYVYPFLLGERFAARVDLRTDRTRGVLQVLASWLEPGHPLPHEEIGRRLAAELGALAGWLGLSAVEVGRTGDFWVPTARAVRQAGLG